MVHEADIKRVVRGPNDLEERIEQLEKQKELLKSHCKKAGETIKTLTKKAQEAEGEMMIVKGIGMNSPEMRAAKARIEELERDREIFKKELDRLSEENNNLRVMMKR